MAALPDFFAVEAPAFAFVPAFLAADLVAAAAFFAAEAPFFAVEVAADFTAVAAFALAWIFLATAKVSPAFLRSLAEALAIFATVLYFAAFSFAAVAFPTPGSVVISEALPDMWFTVFSYVTPPS